MNEFMSYDNRKKFLALANEISETNLLYGIADRMGDNELEIILESIADEWDMMFIEDGTELLHLDEDDCPSWQELMQDNYPSDENGKIFDTPSGF